VALGDGSATAVDEQPQGRGDSDGQPRGRRRAALGAGARRQPRRAVAAEAGARDGQPRDCGRRQGRHGQQRWWRRELGRWWPPGRAATEAAEAAMGTHGGGGERMVVETGD